MFEKLGKQLRNILTEKEESGQSDLDAISLPREGSEDRLQKKENNADDEEFHEFVEEAREMMENPPPPAEGTAESDQSSTDKANFSPDENTVVDDESLQAFLDRLDTSLRECNVATPTTESILERVEDNLSGDIQRRSASTATLVRQALRKALTAVLSVGQSDFESRVAATDNPVVIVVVGPDGAGKTTSLAKLALYLDSLGYSTVLADGDTSPAGATEQIDDHADRLDIPVVTGEQKSDSAEVIESALEYADANDIDIVLGDTPAHLRAGSNLMTELAKIDREIDPELTLYVDEATAGGYLVERAEEFSESVEIDGAVLTRTETEAETDAGDAFSFPSVTGNPILFLGTGEGYDDFKRFDPQAVVTELLEKG